jgi:hypothetical protein
MHMLCTLLLGNDREIKQPLLGTGSTETNTTTALQEWNSAY